MTPIIGVIASSKLKITGSFESIATVTASGSPTSLTFSSIPSTYKSLQIRGIAKDVNAGGGAEVVKLRFNGDTATNYVYHNLTGNGSSVSATGAITQSSIPCGISGSMSSDPVFPNFYGANMIDIIDYASTIKNKTVKGFTGSEGYTYAPHNMSLFSGAWLSTSAITSITILAALTGFANGTTFALYGTK